MNAATQTLAVVVRGLANEDIPWHAAKKIILRSFRRTIKGLLIGMTAGTIAFIFGGHFKLGLVLASAMIINFFIAGLFELTVPFILKRFKIDPAVSSSIL